MSIEIKDIEGNILNKLSDENVVYFHLTVRDTYAGNSKYKDFVFINTELNSLDGYITALVTHYRKYGTIAFLNKDIPLERKEYFIKNSIIKREIVITEELVDYNPIAEKGDTQESDATKKLQDFATSCLNLNPESESKPKNKIYLYYLSTSSSINDNKVSDSEHYGFGSTLFFATQSDLLPQEKKTGIELSLTKLLSKSILTDVVKSSQKDRKKRKESLEENMFLIKTMKDISHHIKTAQKKSNNLQAKFDNFGHIFMEWFSEGLKDVYTTNCDLGYSFRFDVNGSKEHKNKEKGEHTDLKGARNKFIASTANYFEVEKKGDYSFIDMLIQGENKIDDVSERIKSTYKDAKEIFPIGAMLFFLYAKYENSYLNSEIDLKDTDISTPSIVNGLNKLFSGKEIELGNIVVAEDNDFLKLTLTLDNSTNLYQKLIHFNNKELQPYHRTTTNMVRLLLGIGDENYDKEGFCTIKKNEYSIANGIITAMIKGKLLVVSYKLLSESGKG